MKRLDISHYQQRRDLLSTTVQVAKEKVDNHHQCTYEHEWDDRAQNDPLQLDNHGVWMGIEKKVTFTRPWAWCWTKCSETSGATFRVSYLEALWCSAMPKTDTGWAWTGIWSWQRSSTLCRIPCAYVCTGRNSQWCGSAGNTLLCWNRFSLPDFFF